MNARIDGVVEFPPHVIPHSKHLPRYTLSPRLADIAATGNFYDYQKLVDDIVADHDYSPDPVMPLYRGVMLGWDNSARRKTGQSIWYGFDLHKYYLWLKHVIARTRAGFARDRRFVFINAWNEWAEGTYLEPDRQTGYAALNTTSKALYDLPFSQNPLFIDSQTCSRLPGSLKVLVHLHVYHVALLPDLISRLRTLPFRFDLVVTSDTDAKLKEISEAVRADLPSVSHKFVVSTNLGRDIGPMLLDIRTDILKYDIVGHFHTKKSPTVAWGDAWRSYLLDNLMGASGYAASLLKMFEDDAALGLVRPPTFPLIAQHVSWGDVRKRCADLMTEMGLPDMLPAQPHFPVGNMFWARVDAIRPIVERDWQIAEFETEADQLGGTLPHCIERLWDYVVQARDFSVREVMSQERAPSVDDRPAPPRSLCLFVHYSASDRFEDSDLELLRRLNEQVDDIFVVSNSLLGARCHARASLYAQEILVRPNSGLDFAAWRDLIKHLGWKQIESYDEVIFVNNSCYGPVFDFATLFETMRRGKSDFWGVTSFPRLENSHRPEAGYLPDRTIPRHIQSYFVAFSSKVVQSRQFFRFWTEVEDKDDFMNVVASYEARMTEIFEKAGFTWSVYVPEAEYLQQERNEDPRYNAPYSSPVEMILLKCPLIKKRAWDYNPQGMAHARDLVREIGHYPPYLMENGGESSAAVQSAGSRPAL